ncbi:MAG TPA: hypothetical protein VNE39_03125 [Planctomycetota bacterium]|nr:hypothetical protein [Planctomycetota bacterium]
MRLPGDAIIPLEKLTRYLLVPRPRGDKSKFLARAGFTRENPRQLLDALREHVARHDAVAERSSEYGQFLVVEGELAGPNGIRLPVVSVWLRWHKDDSVHFVTLKPGKEY